MSNIKRTLSLILCITLLVISIPYISVAAIANTDNAITLKYDDRYDISNEFPNYYIYDITDENISSYKVDNGICTDEKDSSIISYLDDTRQSFVTTATGDATIRLAPVDVSTPDETQIISVHLNVESAPLTLVYIFGQSNAAGVVCSTKTNGYHPEDSVLCKEGTVYSAFSGDVPKRSENITGISGFESFTEDSAPSFVPGSINSLETKSITDTELTYPINALTDLGYGKTGMDAAFSYTWNKLSNDKVLVVNASISGTMINNFLLDTPNSLASKTFYKYAQQVYEEEIKSNHFTKSKKLCLWLQGESDRATSFDSYYSTFTGLLDNISNYFTYDYLGIILPRACATSEGDTYGELSLTAPRLVQNYIGNSKAYENTFIVSNIGENWITDYDVKSYFSNKYPSQTFDYPLRETSTLYDLPQTVSDTYYDMHFSQIGHNEVGIDSAVNFYNLLNDNEKNINVRWIDSDGTFLNSKTLRVYTGNAFTISSRFTPPYAGKSCTMEYDKEYLSYDEVKQEFMPLKNGESYIKLYNKNNELINTLKISASTTNTPQITSIIKSGTNIIIKWTPVKNVYAYKVFYKNGTSWKTITTTQNNYYVYTPMPGKELTYTIRCCDKNGSYTSSYNKVGESYKLILNTPKISLLTSERNGIGVYWNAVPGAYGYRVFYKSGTSWKVFDTTTKTSSIFTDAKDQQRYTFTVRCINSEKEFASSYNSIGTNKKYNAPPVLTKVENTTAGVKIYWNEKPIDTTYRIYRKTSTGSWIKLDDIKTNYYLDTTYKSGTTYYYTVRCISNDLKSFTSSFDATGLKILAMGTPKITNFIPQTKGCKIVWNKVGGAEKYRVFIKQGTSWKVIATTTNNYFTYTSAKKGDVFTIRCVNKDNTKYTSSYYSSGFTYS